MHAFDPLFHVANDRIERLAARESEQLTGQALSAMGGRVDGIDPLQILGVAEPPTEKLGITPDDHQQIVEVVRNAACQLAKRFHLLGLGELLLRPAERSLRLAPFGNVSRDMHEASQGAHLIADRLDHHARPESALVASHAPALDGIFALIGGDLKGARGAPPACAPSPEKNRLKCRPMTSAAAYWRIRCARVFQLVMQPSPSSMK